MLICERISNLRKSIGLSQYQLAKLLSVSRQAVSKWENGLSVPDMNNLIQLADILKTDVEYLVSGKSSIPSPSILPVTKIVEPPRIVEVEKVVEKVVHVDRPIYVEVDRVIEVDKPIVKKVFRTKYLRNPIEYLLVGILFFTIGLIVGILL